jgi:hypothetical protein
MAGSKFCSSVFIMTNDGCLFPINSFAGVDIAVSYPRIL